MGTVAEKRINGLQIGQHDFSYKNNFKNRVWSYLRVAPQLNYHGYQRKSKDYQCKQDVFNEVKKDIELFGIWDPLQLCIIPKTPSAIERIELLTKPQTPEKELPPSSPVVVEPTPIGNQLALANAAPRRARQHLDLELKDMVRAEFKAKPTITFDELQAKINWPDFKKPNYYNLRQEMIRSGEIDLPIEGVGQGRKPPGEAMLCRKHLMEMKLEDMKKMTFPLYMEKYRNHGLDAKNFVRALAWASRQRGEQAQAKTIESPVATVANPIGTKVKPIVAAALSLPDEAPIQAQPSLPANAIVVLSTIAIPTSVPSEHHLAIKEMFTKWFDDRHKQAGKKNNVKCMLLTDPACIEIRKPVN